jgi:hypothetical protein
MTWHVEIQTDARLLVWEFEAATAEDFRRTLNALGRADNVEYRRVSRVTFVRVDAA